MYEVNGQKEKKKENIDKVNAQLSTEEVFKHTVKIINETMSHAV